MNLIKGTIILSIAGWISKILGLLYVIPFIALVGIQGNILYEYAYKPYAIMLSVSSLGIPIAVSQFVSKYNQLGEYDTSNKIFKTSLIFMSFTGFVGFLLMMLFAPNIAELLVNKNDMTGNKFGDIVYVIRMVSTALLIVPTMSAIRGYFQGHGATMPTAVSQVLEQLIRIIFILISSYYVLKILKGNMKIAIGWATFGATIGAITGIGVLFWYLYIWKEKLKPKKESKKVSISTKAILKEIILHSIPFVIVSLAIPLYQLIETYTINGALMSIGYKQVQAEHINSLVALVQKLILIPTGLATAFGLTLVPAITNAYTAKNNILLNEYITKTFKILLFTLMPTVALMMAFPQSIFGIMFGWKYAIEGGKIAFWYSPTLILYSLFIVTAAILQGINKHKFVVITLILGVVAKLLLNPMLTRSFEGLGVVASTNVGFILSVAINLWGIKRYCSFSYGSVWKQIQTIIYMSIGLFALAYLLNRVGILAFKLIRWNLYIENILLVMIVGGVSGCLFLWYSMKNGMLYDLLGARLQFLNRFKKK